MVIHYSANFNGREWAAYHGSFETNVSVQHLQKNVNALMSDAIVRLKDKCSRYNVDFLTIEKFEMYYFENGDEIKLYEKSKN